MATRTERTTTWHVSFSTSIYIVGDNTIYYTSVNNKDNNNNKDNDDNDNYDYSNIRVFKIRDLRLFTVVSIRNPPSLDKVVNICEIEIRIQYNI